MAGLQQTYKSTPTLSQLANLVRKKAVGYAPKKTGNLKRALEAYNRPSGMVKETLKNKQISYTISLDVAPPGAEYGKFWNDPNVSYQVRNGKTSNVQKSINFAQQALNDPEVQQLIERLIEDSALQITNYIQSEVNKLDK